MKVNAFVTTGHFRDFFSVLWERGNFVILLVTALSLVVYVLLFRGQNLTSLTGEKDLPREADKKSIEVKLASEDILPPPSGTPPNLGGELRENSLTSIS